MDFPLYEARSFVLGSSFEKRWLEEYRNHPFHQWIENNISLEIISEITGSHKNSSHEMDLICDLVISPLVNYYEREEYPDILKRHVLKKGKRNKIKTLAKKLYSELEGLPPIVNKETQSELVGCLEYFIDDINYVKHNGLAISKLHKDANRQILINELALSHFEKLGKVAVSLVTKIVYIVDSSIDEKRVNELIIKVNPNLIDLTE